MLTPRPVHLRRALAGCASAAMLVMLAGCSGAGPSGRVPAPAAASTGDAAAQVASTASTVPSDGTVSSRTSTPSAVRATVPPTPSGANQPPVVRSISSVPEQVNPLDCRPPNPPERPEVIVTVDDPDDPVDTLEVRLQYSSGTSYQGDVRMRFDAKRQAFVYTLPPVTRAAVGNDARNIMIAVQLPSPSPAPPPPPTHWILFKGYCLGKLPAGN